MVNPLLAAIQRKKENDAKAKAAAEASATPEQVVDDRPDAEATDDQAATTGPILDGDSLPAVEHTTQQVAKPTLGQLAMLRAKGIVDEPPKVNPLALAASRAAESRKSETQDFSYLITEPPKDFKELTDRFDMLMARDTGITDFNIDGIRSYVQRIMVDLKEQPELDGMLTDKTVAGIIRFIRATRERAIETVVKKSDAAVKKASKAKPSSRFGDTALSLDLTALPTDIKSMGDWDL